MLRDLWKTSGHTGFYKDSNVRPMEVEKADYQLKPMNVRGTFSSINRSSTAIAIFPCAWPN